jgi:tetratricopeptide (TPR) repeat protein
MFSLDLHGVLTNEAVRTIRIRLRECYRYGLRTLRVAFGSPDGYEGTILESLCEIVQIDPNVIIGELPEWVSAPKLKRDSRIIFLAIPLRPNPKPETLGAETIFQKFTAAKEENAGQRLLCATPFQPFRTLYDWKYAARAIGKTCNEKELELMCTQTELVPSGADGVNLTTLLRAAELFTAWMKRRPKALEVLEVKLLTSEIQEAQPTTPEATAGEINQLPIETEPTGWDLLRLFDRVLESAFYERAAEILSNLELTIGTGELDFEYALRKARLLLRQHDPSCETWLLRSDELCVKIHGQGSIRRRQVIELLQFWYSTTGEAGRVLQYAEIAGSHLPKQDDIVSRERRLQNQFVFAAHLSATARHHESVATLCHALWEIVLENEGAIPKEFRIDEKSLKESRIPIKLLIRVMLHLGKDSIELDETDAALAYLRISEGLAKLLASHHVLKAEIYSQMGRAWRRCGQNTTALDFYQLALDESSLDDDPDPEVMFLIYLNRGVALANTDDLRMAGKAYSKAEKFGLEVYDSDHPELFRLVFSQATLSLKRRYFFEAAQLATRAAEILELKAPERVSELGFAYMRAGEANLHSKKYRESLRDFEKAQASWLMSIEPISPEHTKSLRHLSNVAKNGLAGRVRPS